MLALVKTDRLQVPSSNTVIWNPSPVTVSTQGRQEVAWGYMAKSGNTRSSGSQRDHPIFPSLLFQSMPPSTGTLAMPEARPQSR